jgi:hypothetical protein
MHWQAFWDYVEAVAHHIPWWGYAMAIGIFIIGSAIAFIKRGRNEGLRLSAGLFLLLYVMVLYLFDGVFQGNFNDNTLSL